MMMMMAVCMMMRRQLTQAVGEEEQTEECPRLQVPIILDQDSASFQVKTMKILRREVKMMILMMILVPFLAFQVQQVKKGKGPFTQILVGGDAHKKCGNFLGPP